MIAVLSAIILQDKPQQKAEKLDAGPELVRAPPAKLEARHCGFFHVKRWMSSSNYPPGERNFLGSPGGQKKGHGFLLPL